jgi:riboflavin synthase
MFTGIVQEIGEVKGVQKTDALMRMDISAPKLVTELRIGSSVSVAGACLTVTQINQDVFSVEIVPETLRVTTFGKTQVGTKYNLEPALRADGRFDGHIVQGHVDTVAQCVGVESEGESYRLTLHLSEPTSLLIPKGSICIDGVSLTIAEIASAEEFSVVIIPHTWQNTTLSALKAQDNVHIEFDMLVKSVGQITNFKF